SEQEARLSGFSTIFPHSYYAGPERAVRRLWLFSTPHYVTANKARCQDAKSGADLEWAKWKRGWPKCRNCQLIRGNRGLAFPSSNWATTRKSSTWRGWTQTSS